MQEWNRQRSLALERALLRILYPLMVRELKAKLLEESKLSIIRVNISSLLQFFVSLCLYVSVCLSLDVVLVNVVLQTPLYHS